MQKPAIKIETSPTALKQTALVYGTVIAVGVLAGWIVQPRVAKLVTNGFHWKAVEAVK